MNLIGIYNQDPNCRKDIPYYLQNPKFKWIFDWIIAEIYIGDFIDLNIVNGL